MRRKSCLVATGRQAQCCAPFRLRPRDIITSQAGLNGIEKQQHLLAAITDYYQQHYADACKLRGDQPLPIIATGH